MRPLRLLRRIFKSDLAENLGNQLERRDLIPVFGIETHKNSPLGIRVPFCRRSTLSFQNKPPSGLTKASPDGGSMISIIRFPGFSE